MKQKNATVHYSLIQIVYWVGFAAIMAYTSLYLLDLGFSNAIVGIIIALAGIGAAISQPIVASYADKKNSLPLWIILLILSGIIAALGLALSIMRGNVKILGGIFFALSIMVLQLMQPMVNALAMESVNAGFKLNVGIAQAIGSAGYAITSFILGQLTDKHGASIVPFSFTGAFILFMVILFIYPHAKKVNTVSNETVKKKQSPIAFFMRYKKFTILLIGLIGIYISHLILNSFTLQIVVSKGGAAKEMGNTIALCCFIQLPMMLIFSFLVKKIKIHNLIRISGIFFALKVIATLFVTNMVGMYLAQIFQAGAWGIMAVALVYYVNSQMEGDDVIKGQAYAGMTYTLGSVFGSLIGGPMIDQLGVNALLIFGSVAASLGAALIFIAAEKRKVE